MKKLCLSFFVYFFLAAIAVSFLPCGNVVYAHHKKQVLGESTVASELTFPPVTSGPGFILPDSPLYFLDNFVQEVRLIAALTPESKARVRSQIAGERMAELRLMLSRDDKKGIDIALAGLKKENALASGHLREAAAQGKDVSLLARDLNDSMRTHRDVLRVLVDQSDGSLRLQLKAAQEEVKLAKVEVEDELPPELLEQEIEEGLEAEVSDEVEQAEQSTKDIEHDLIELEKQATSAAKKELTKREEAIQKAIEEKNEQLVKVKTGELTVVKKRQEKLTDIQKEKIEEARRAVQEARQAAKKFEEAKREEEAVRKSEETEVSSSGDSSSDVRATTN